MLLLFIRWIFLSVGKLFFVINLFGCGSSALGYVSWTFISSTQQNAPFY